MTAVTVWDFDRATRVLAEVKPLEEKAESAKVGVVFLAGVASAYLGLGAIGVITFTATILTAGAALVVTAVALYILAKKWDSDVRKATEGLTGVERAKLAATQLSHSGLQRLARVKDDIIKTNQVLRELNEVSPGLLQRRYYPGQDLFPEYVVDDTHLSSERVLTLLDFANTFEVILHFKSLEWQTHETHIKIQTRWLKAGNVVPLIERAVLLATYYAGKYYQTYDKAGEFINRQIQALMPKVINSHKEAKAISPLIEVLNRTTIRVSSYAGESGELRPLRNQLCSYAAMNPGEVLEIHVESIGFEVAHKNAHPYYCSRAFFGYLGTISIIGEHPRLPFWKPGHIRVDDPVPVTAQF